MTTDHINPELPDRSDDTGHEASAGAQKATGTDRPFGFWLKLVDRRLSDEMQTLFAADGITRRDWRMLNLLAGEARDERLAERLRSKPHALHHLAERGWIAGAPPVLTDAGREARDRLEGPGARAPRARRGRRFGRGLRDHAAEPRGDRPRARLGRVRPDAPRPPRRSSPRLRRRHGFGGGHGFGGWHGAGRGTPPGVTRASASRAAKTSTSTCTCTTTTDVRAAATVTTAGRAPRPDRSADPQPGALDGAPGCAVRCRSRTANGEPHVRQGQRRHATEVEPAAQLAVADATAPGIAYGRENRQGARPRRQPRQLDDIHAVPVEARLELLGGMNIDHSWIAVSMMRVNRHSCIALMASSLLRLVRLIVSKRYSPPGRSTRAVSAMTRSRSATCSSTSQQNTRSNAASANGSLRRRRPRIRCRDRSRRMGAGRLDGDSRRIDARHGDIRRPPTPPR